MAQVQEVRLVDDLDGGDANITIKFGWEGKWRQIDLSTKNSDQFEDLMAPYVEASTPVRDKGHRLASVPKLPATRDREQTAAIRAWARKNGFSVSDRGRIPRAVEDAYNKRELAS